MQPPCWLLAARSLAKIRKNKFDKTQLIILESYQPLQAFPFTQSSLGCFGLLLLLLTQMEIPECPVLRPTAKEFKNFQEFVQKVDRLYKHNFGMVKVSFFQSRATSAFFPSMRFIIQVIPPPEWKSKCADYSSRLENLVINGPIEQNISGKGGVYECLHIQKKSMSLKQYRSKMGVFDKITQDLSSAEVQSMFWKNIVFSPPIYGADLLQTLMDEQSGSWNLNNLDSLLKYAIDINVRGVTSSYCYIGSWKTLFCWHKEDLDLSAINFLHQGKSKFWYSIPSNQSQILQKEAKLHFPQHFSKCPEHLRHKTTLINPYLLKRKYPQLKITKVEHRPGEFMLVLGGSYHCGFNFGLNIAEAINYGTLDWLNQLPYSKACRCSRSSVKADHTEVLKKLEKSPFATTPQFQRFKVFVYNQVEKEEEQQEKAEQKKGVKLEFSKKIKKDKCLPKKIKFKGEDYAIENWAQCDSCQIWRKLSSNPITAKSFICQDAGKVCHKRQGQKSNNSYILL